MRSIHLIRTLPLLAVLIAALAASAGGCGDDTKPDLTGGTGGGVGGAGGDGGTGGDGGVGGTGGPDVPTCEVDDDCDTWERCDETDKICVPRCTMDADCGRNLGLRCDTDSGACMAGEPCMKESNCGSDPAYGKYCDQRNPAKRCWCAPDQSMQQKDPPREGVCWRESGACDECETDAECGNNGVCQEYNYGGETKRVCLKKAQQATICAAGMIPANAEENPDLAGLCVPQFGDCKDFRPCKEDSDCNQVFPVCDKQRQICNAGCSFNYETNNSQGCAPDKVCHSTREGTTPSILDDCARAHLWGIGKCADPCETNDDCTEIGDNWLCQTYGKEKRCVPPNECLDDSQCNDTSPGQVEVGFCNVDTFQCNYDACRLGNDKRIGCTSNKPYPDCSETYKCVVNPETPDNRVHGFCDEKDCIDLKGADTGCGFSRFCAGEHDRDMMTGQELESFKKIPEGVSRGECYGMEPLADWCSNCSSHEECNSNATGRSELPALCLQFQEGNFCAPPCLYNQDCPSGWRCSSDGFEATCNPGNPGEESGGLKTCEADIDCGGAAGSCVDLVVGGSPYSFRDRMEPFKVCACTPGDANSCPGEYTCNAGIGTSRKGVIQNHYCSISTKCGNGGSCEFMGANALLDPNDPDNSPYVPVFQCATGGPELPGAATCPTGFVPGMNAAAKHHCVQTQICIPALFDGECKIP